MKSVRGLPDIALAGAPVEIRNLAAAHGFRPPISLRDLLRALSFHTFPGQITTPDPEALSGNVDLTIRGDGRYELKIHMHDSGLPDYSFRLGIYLRAESGKSVLAWYSRGVVHGTLSPGSRDSDERQTGVLPSLLEQWDDFSRGTLNVHREYQNDLVGWIESAALDIATFLIGCVTVGAPAACAIFGASLLGSLTGTRLPGELGLAGLVAAEGVYYLCGPAAFIPVFIGGALVSAELFKRRRLHPPEIAAARSVFEGTIPYDRIWITNLEDLDGRPFTALGIDGSVMIGLGSWYENGLADQATRGTLIHELTHVWQIEHEPTLTVLCTGSVNRARRAVEGNQAVYDYGVLGAPWDAYNWEQQAEIIALADWWRQEFTEAGLSYDHLPTEVYIRNHILMG